MSISLWNIPNWFNWYWWGLDDIEKEDPNEVSTIKEEPELKKEKPKRKATRKKAASKPKEIIQLILRPTILEELEKEAQGVDSTLNQLIQIILEAHIESKDNHPIEPESWKCSFCDPQEEFLDYFKYSEHFFAKHMQPGLEKLSKINSDN